MKHVIAVMLTIGILGIIIQTASATVISVEPSYLQVSPGEEFTVNITVDPEGNGTYGAQYILNFDNVLLRALRQKQGSFLSQDGANTDVYSNEINSTIGQVRYGESRKGKPEVIGGVTTPGTLAMITFEAIGPGMCNLNLSKVKLTKTDTQPIPDVLINNGTVEFEAYTFDTGTSENPYQSISGMHNGTIILNHTVVVNGIFTYSCPGTGGHSEYVAFYNATTGEEIANGTWEGYSGDWHNITFKEPFELQAGAYNYTIKTGSYPQIIHVKEYNATGGKITCREFIDANGNTYCNWIPAIRLF